MADLSIAVLVGRLTRDAELKYTPSGQPICHFSIATGANVKKGGQWVDEASFWDVDLWGKQGESLNQYLTKGKMVAVEGSMRQDRWEQDGQAKMKVIVNANSVQLLGGGQDSGQTRQDTRPDTRQEGCTTGRATAQTPSHPAPLAAPSADDFSDDIPF